MNQIRVVLEDEISQLVMAGPLVLSKSTAQQVARMAERGSSASEAGLETALEAADLPPGDGASLGLLLSLLGRMRNQGFKPRLSACSDHAFDLPGALPHGTA
ncbi:MAG: hypothetical protein QM742_07395 [Aquabacterium sp.]